MAAWPATLPQKMLQEGWRTTLAPVTIRSQMDTGPVKIRRRFTAAPRPYDFEEVLTDSQLVTFKTFWTTDTAEGSLSFTWVNPETGAGCTMRFLSEPEITSAGGVNYRLKFKVEMLP